VSAWGTLRALRERALICATESDEPISGADAVDELAAIREQLDAALAREPDVGAAFAELEAAMREDGEASWAYAEALEGSDESAEAYAECERTKVRLIAALDAVRGIAGAPR
jgi:hypothetical protein